jgi:hypothetical protein
MLILQVIQLIQEFFFAFIYPIDRIWFREMDSSLFNANFAIATNIKHFLQPLDAPFVLRNKV